MARKAFVTHFVAVSDLSRPLKSQEGILIEVAGKGGDSPENRAKALEIAAQMWENGAIEAGQFPDGLTEENIVYVPPDSSPELFLKKEPKNEPIPPIVKGAQEIIELTKLQLEVQQMVEDAKVYLPIIQTLLDGKRPLTAKEKDLVQDKQFSKTLEKLALTIAKQDKYRSEGVKYAKLILNAITWQSGQGVKTSTQSQKSPKTRSTRTQKAKTART
jgi:hypothetical protein